MCGIAGWIDCRKLCDSTAIMRRMAQTMIPRGPDSGGFYTDDNCALAHRRLSVIDPAGGSQPMTAILCPSSLGCKSRHCLCNGIILTPTVTPVKHNFIRNPAGNAAVCA